MGTEEPSGKISGSISKGTVLCSGGASLQFIHWVIKTDLKNSAKNGTLGNTIHHPASSQV